MDFYEEAVLFHLTAIRQMLVLPQAAILEHDSGGRETWSAYPDFLALDFKRPGIEVVEVTKLPTLKKIRGKCDQVYLKKVEQIIREKILRGHLASFPLNWHFIVRSQMIAKVQAEIDRNSLGSIVEVSSLEKLLEEIGRQLP